MKRLSYWLAYALHLMLEKTFNWLDFWVFLILMRARLWLFLVGWIVWCLISVKLKAWYDEMKKPLPTERPSDQ